MATDLPDPEDRPDEPDEQPHDEDVDADEDGYVDDSLDDATGDGGRPTASDDGEQPEVDGEAGDDRDHEGDPGSLPKSRSGTVILGKPISPDASGEYERASPPDAVPLGGDVDAYGETLILDPPSERMLAIRPDPPSESSDEATVIDPPDGDEPPVSRGDWLTTVIDAPPGKKPPSAGDDGTPEDALKTLIDPLPEPTPADALRTLIDPPPPGTVPGDDDDDGDAGVPPGLLTTLVDPPPPGTRPGEESEPGMGDDDPTVDDDVPPDAMKTLVDPPPPGTIPGQDAGDAVGDDPDPDAGRSDDGFDDTFTVGSKSASSSGDNGGGDDFLDNFSVSTSPKKPAASGDGDDFFDNFSVKADLKASHRGYGYEEGEEEDDDDEEEEPLPDDLERAATALILEATDGASEGSQADELDFSPALASGDGADTSLLEQLLGARSGGSQRQWDSQAVIDDWNMTNPGEDGAWLADGRPPTRMLPPPPPPPVSVPAPDYFSGESTIPVETFGLETTQGLSIYDMCPAFVAEQVSPTTRVLALPTVARRLDSRPIDPENGIELDLDAPAWIPEPVHEGSAEWSLGDTTVTGDLPEGWGSIIRDMRASGHETWSAPDPVPDPVSRVVLPPAGAADPADASASGDLPDLEELPPEFADLPDESDEEMVDTHTDEPLGDLLDMVAIEEIEYQKGDSGRHPGITTVVEGDDDERRALARLFAEAGGDEQEFLEDADAVLGPDDFMAPTETQVIREVEALTSGVTDRFAQLEREREVLREKYHQLLQSYDRIRAAVRLAKAYQEQMLPAAPEDLTDVQVGVLYKPAEHVSGDFYDFVQLDEHRWAVTIGDISGHGIAPALIMTVCKKLIHVFLQQGRGPADALREANTAIFPDLPAATFITAITGVIDTQANTFTYARAGHPAMILFNPGKRGPEPLMPEPKGMALGMDPGPIFDRTLVEESISTQPGDLLVLYSDGVIELPNTRREQFGRDRFVDILREFGYGTVPFLMRKINTTVQGWRAGRGQDDDVTVVVLKFLTHDSAETVLKRASSADMPIPSELQESLADARARQIASENGNAPDADADDPADDD